MDGTSGGPKVSAAQDPIPSRRDGSGASAGRGLGELVAAASVGVLGIYLITKGFDYSVGSFRQMGPGFFPLVLGIVLAVFSVGLLAEALRAPMTAESINWRPIFFVIPAITLFGFVVPRFGLIPATVMLVLLSALSERAPEPKVVIGVAVGLSLIAWLVFLHFLKLPLPAFRW